MSELYQLPDGWEWKKLGEVTSLVGGGTPSRNIIDYWENGNIVWLSPTDLGNIGEINSIANSKDKITQLGLEKSSARLLPIGAVLFSSRATIGKIAINTIELSTNQGFTNFICNDSLNNQYLAYCLVSFTKEITALSNSTTFKEVSKSALKEFNIPVAQLAEQKRIVQKLDALFERIDKAIALLQKNIDAANNFMNSVLNDVFSELEQNHEIDNIGNILEVLTDYHSNGAYKTLKANVELLDHEDYAIMVRATDLENNDFSKNIKYITKEAYNFMSKSKIFGGEVIVPKIGTIGNVYLMPYLNSPASLAMNTFLLRCSDRVINKFLFLYLKSPRGHEDILSRANGAVTKTITKDAIKSIELPLPSRLIQEKIVLFCDELSAKIEQIKSAQQQKMQNLLDLKSSILDQAFHGKL